MRRRLTIAVAVPLTLAGVITILWTAFDWPPPRLMLKYGLPPAGGPTGRRHTVAGIEFAEVRPGYVSVLTCECVEEDLIWRVRRAWGLLSVTDYYIGPVRISREWLEVPETVWVSTESVWRSSAVASFPDCIGLSWGEEFRYSTTAALLLLADGEYGATLPPYAIIREHEREDPLTGVGGNTRYPGGAWTPASVMDDLETASTTPFVRLLSDYLVGIPPTEHD